MIPAGVQRWSQKKEDLNSLNSSFEVLEALCLSPVIPLMH